MPRRDNKLIAFRNEAEAWMLRETMAKHGGNVTYAARELGVFRTHLYKRLYVLGVMTKQELKERECRVASAMSPEFRLFLSMRPGKSLDQQTT